MMLKRLFLTASLALLPLSGMAQDIAQVDSETHWSIYVTDSPKECFIVSQPQESRAQRNGQTVRVNRGDIRLYLTNVPEQSIKNEPSFLAGYPLSKTQAVEVKIGDASFAFYPNAATNDEFAWPKPEDDTKLIDAMRKGADAVVTGVSSRGTTTIDTFSLLGFTAALAKAEELCQ